MRKLKNEELDRLSIEEFKKKEKVGVSIILDNVRSMHNVGSAFRTADAFLIEKIYLTGITATPPHREINKTALGATESVEWEYHKDSIQLVKGLKSDGLKIDFSTSWVHLRKSNTEPIIRIYTEAKSEHEANELANKIIDEIESSVTTNS